VELYTYTTLWKVERRLYKIYDFTLPMPVSLRQVGAFIGSTIPWFMLLSLLNVPFAAPWHLLWLAPPALFTWYANRPVAEDKSLIEYVGAQLSYFLGQPRQIDRLNASEGTFTRAVTVREWAPRSRD
jgi:TcpE family